VRVNIMRTKAASLVKRDKNVKGKPKRRRFRKGDPGEHSLKAAWRKEFIPSAGSVGEKDESEGVRIKKGGSIETSVG